jgi:oligopeptide transport system ATP-binding protein
MRLATLLKIENLRVSFHTYAGELRAVRNVGFELGAKETLAIVGESGCGKTVTAKSITRLIERSGGVIKEGSKIIYQGKDILSMDKKELAQIRGKEISMIFQDPMTSLNPTMKIGNQIAECLRAHGSIAQAEARQKVKDLLSLVGIPDPEQWIDDYPHRLSGGMRQRVMIAIALACSPRILIADEPTTALDVTIAAQILDLLRDLKEQMGMSVILVTHDLGVVAGLADRVQVMYGGTILERGTVREIFREPKHPYTWALLNSLPGRSKEAKSDLYSIRGSPPDLLLPLQECPFAARCDYGMRICRRESPPETRLTETHGVACWLTHSMAPGVSYASASGHEYSEGGSPPA